MAWSPPLGVAAPQTYNAGYVTLSYLISVVGSLTTIELLRLRTANRGRLNWILLVSSAITMGAVAIFCMHYIGNLAITLYYGRPDVQLSYSGYYTALSLLLPVIVLTLAYLILGGSNGPVKIWRLAMGGTFAGLAIAGMHYIGQLSILNYSATYSIGHIIGSVLIAVLATNVALALFFVLRNSWTDVWWKRLGCSFLLAGAVAGMHWTAARGTKLFPIASTIGMGSSGRRSNIIAVGVVSSSACMFLLTLAYLEHRRNRAKRDRAQKVGLAAAVFDPEGRIMLSIDGSVPALEITDQYQERSFDDLFDASHPVFHWIMRASYHWNVVGAIAPIMRKHVQISRASRIETSYSDLFKEMFIVAAQRLADSMQISITKLGVCYDQIIRTGFKVNGDTDPEAAQPFGRGQFIFLVRHVDRAQAADFQHTGFRFTDLSTAGPVIARSFEIRAEVMKAHLERLLSYEDTSNYFCTGIHLGLFAVQPTPSSGLQVLVSNEYNSCIPHLLFTSDVHSISEIRSLFDPFVNRSINDIVSELRQISSSSRRDATQTSWLGQLHGALVSLQSEFNSEQWIGEAVMTPIQLGVSTKNEVFELERITGQLKAIVIIFRTMISVYKSRNGKSKLKFVPLGRFKALHQAREGDIDRLRFLEEVRLLYERMDEVFEGSLITGTSAQGGLRTRSISICKRLFLPKLESPQVSNSTSDKPLSTMIMTSGKNGDHVGSEEELVEIVSKGLISTARLNNWIDVCVNSFKR